MKKLLLTTFLAIGIVSCKKKATNVEVKQEEQIKQPIVEQDSEMKKYPEDLSKVFKAHGGLDNWKQMNQLSYDLPKKNITEHHLVDLKSRKTVLSSDKYTIGFDGKDVWLTKGSEFPADRARFYHNLYFYFYAMPFILADEGIVYNMVDDLQIGDKSYPGIKISYKSNVGDSPDDNYFIYYDPETYKMTWLGYTVTYGDDKPSTEVHYINYKDWQEVNGLVLPKVLEWYSVENNLPKDPTGSQEFKMVIASKDKPDSKLFVKPEDGLIGKK